MLLYPKHMSNFGPPSRNVSRLKPVQDYCIQSSVSHGMLTFIHTSHIHFVYIIIKINHLRNFLIHFLNSSMLWTYFSASSWMWILRPDTIRWNTFITQLPLYWFQLWLLLQIIESLQSLLAIDHLRVHQHLRFHYQLRVRLPLMSKNHICKRCALVAIAIHIDIATFDMDYSAHFQFL